MHRRIVITGVGAAATFVSMHIKIAKPCSNANRKAENTELLSEEILKSGKVSWARILETGDYNELIYNLTPKYLRQGWYDRDLIKFQELNGICWQTSRSEHDSFQQSPLRYQHRPS